MIALRKIAMMLPASVSVLAVTAIGAEKASSQPVRTPLPTPLQSRAIPMFSVSGYPTLIVHGMYPVLAGSAPGSDRVNKELRRAVVSEEEGFRRLLASMRPHMPASARRALHGGFEMTFSRLPASASDELVSVLMKANECVPGCTHSGTWFSMSVQVPAGTRITLRSLFAKPTRALKALAGMVTRRVTTVNGCVRRYLDPVGFAPTWKNYRFFALLPAGLAIGFPTSQVSLPVCGRISVVLPYRSLDSYLGPLGRRLIAAVRSPRS